MVARKSNDRIAIATLAAEVSWSNTVDRKARTEPARQAAADRFRREIDTKYPDVPEAQRADMAEHLRRAHFLRMALKSAQVRRANNARKARPSTKDGEPA